MRLMGLLVLVLLLFSSFSYALLGEKGDVIITNFIPGITKTQGDNLYCLQGGNCTFYNLTVNSTTVIINNYNVTGDINATGNITGDYLFGFLDFTWITNWDFAYIYNGIKSYILDDFYNKTQVYNKSEADAKFCTTCGGSPTTGGNETLVYANECDDVTCSTFIQVAQNEN